MQKFLFLVMLAWVLFFTGILIVSHAFAAKRGAVYPLLDDRRENLYVNDAQGRTFVCVYRQSKNVTYRGYPFTYYRCAKDARDLTPPPTMTGAPSYPSGYQHP